MSTPIGIIRKFVKTLVETDKTATEAADEAFKAVGAGTYSAFKSAFNTARSNYSSYQDFLEQVCGIRLNNKDTGAITGSDAGFSKTQKTAESIMPETAAAKELTDAEYNSFTKNGLTVNVTYENITDGSDYRLSNFNYDTETYLAKQKLITRALYNWWIPEALDLINQSLGVNFTDGRSYGNEINIVFGDTSVNDRAIEVEYSYDMGLASEITMTIDADQLYNMTADDKNGTLPDTERIHIVNEDGSGWYSENYVDYLDRLILEAMTDITLKSNIAYAYKLPKEILYGLCAIVGGYDDATDNYYYFTANDTTEIAGYGKLRWLAKNYSDGTPDDDDVSDLPDGLSYNDDTTILTATTTFTGDKIDLADFEGTVKTVDASALKSGIEIIGNSLGNSLKGGSGADTLAGGASTNDTLTGGSGKDLFIYSGGNDVITDYASGDKISINSTVDNPTVSGSDMVFVTDSGSLRVKNAKNKTVSVIDSNGREYTIELKTFAKYTNDSSAKVTLSSDVANGDATERTKNIRITGNAKANSILGGSGNDVIIGNAGNDTLLGNAGDDTLSGGAGADKLLGGAGDDSLVGGDGKDSLSGGNGDDTLSGGKGNDTLTGGNGNDLFIYSAGSDIITDYEEGDTIQISSGKVKSTKTSGKNFIITVGSNKISVMGGAGKVITCLDKNGNVTTYPETVKFSSDGKGATILSNYTSDDFDIAKYGDYKNSVKTISGAAVAYDISITGNKLMNKIIGGDGNDTLIGGKGNDTLTGGEGADVFVYNKGDGLDVITDYTSDDKISLAAGLLEDISVSGSDVVFVLDGGKITVKDAKDKVISYDDGSKQFTYPQTVNLSGTKATILETYLNDNFNADDYKSSLKTIDAAQVPHGLRITGNKLANKITGSEEDDYIDGGASKDTIIGGDGNDTIIGGKGNDSLKGGAGADVFVYASGDGNDIITDYSSEDKISISSGKVSSKKTSGNNVIFTVGSGKISVKGGKSKLITYVDSTGVNYYPAAPDNNVLVNDTTVTLLKNYAEQNFSADDYDDNIKTIDASSVARDLVITGNAKANVILGGFGHDTIIGGKNNDTLYGSDGDDVFVYNNGDGNDLIVDYGAGDKISLASGSVKSSAVKGDDYVFTVGANKITLKNAANKSITVVNSKGAETTYNQQGNVAWFLEDDNNFSTTNELDSLIETKTYLPAQIDFVDSFKENSFVTYSNTTKR